MTDASDQASSDSFMRDRLAWQDQVLADRGLTLLALHVALVVSQHINRQTGEAWPAQERIAEQLHVTARGVRGAIEQLVSKNHLTVADRRNRTESNRYRLSLHERNDRSARDEHERNYGSSQDQFDRNDGSSQSTVERNGGSVQTPFERNHGSCARGTVVPPNPLNEPFEEIDSISASSLSKPKRARAKPQTSDDDFHELWLQYPRKNGKAEARRAYDRIITAGEATHGELMAGAMRYAAERGAAVERNPADARFTKHPATWLNKGCWTDEPALVLAEHQYQRNEKERFSALDYVARRFGDE